MDLRSKFAETLKKAQMVTFPQSSVLYTLNQPPPVPPKTCPSMNIDAPHNATEQYYQSLLRSNQQPSCPAPSTSQRGVRVLPPLPPTYDDAKCMPTPNTQPTCPMQPPTCPINPSLPPAPPLPSPRQFPQNPLPLLPQPFSQDNIYDIPVCRTTVEKDVTVSEQAKNTVDNIKTSIKQSSAEAKDNPIVYPSSVESPGAIAAKPLTPVDPPQSVKDLTSAMRTIESSNKVKQVDISGLHAALMNRMRSLNPDLKPDDDNDDFN
ncbi:hypothetical protein [Pteropox virus]|uniref:Uncharacterized protein n=1 Tax=Pteropox virus TaxID=1873698 RepID=A0A1B1MRJ5_9POXV|nr:hypothetical protein [Pteropox virus]ANS71182.1 hypothetical protein [Pteropox virus]